MSISSTGSISSSYPSYTSSTSTSGTSTGSGSSGSSSSSSGSSSSSLPLGLSGLGGYDFSGIINQLMQAYKMPENQFYTQVNTLQTKRQAWQDVNSRLTSLDNTLTTLRSASTWSATQATSSDTTKVAVSGTGAAAGTYNVTVNNIAQTQNVVSAVQNVSSATAATTVSAGTFTITVGGTAKTVSVNSGDSLSTIAADINKAGAGVTASVVQVNGGYQLAIADNSTGVANAAAFADATGSVLKTLGVVGAGAQSNVFNVTNAAAVTTLAASTLTIKVGSNNLAPVNITAGESLSQVAQAINALNGGVTASVRPVSGGFQLFINNAPGALGTSLSFTDTTPSGLGLATVAANVATVVQAGLDASLNVNGVNNIVSATNNVTGAIQGLTLTLNGAGNSTLQVSPNSSVAQNAVQAFVNQYNSTINFIAQDLSYDPNTKYTGVLFGDPTLSAIQTNLRTMMSGFFNNPTGPYTSLSSIGITTSGANYGQDPSLTFDTTKFATAMATNPNSVANLFGAPAGGVTPSTTPATAQGVANQLDAYLQPLISYGGTLSKTQNNINNQITNVQKQIANFDQRAAQYQATLVQQYSQLNTLISSWNSQGSWLTQQVNAMTSTSSRK